jgi:hypothetical protein
LLGGCLQCDVATAPGKAARLVFSPATSSQAWCRLWRLSGGWCSGPGPDPSVRGILPTLPEWLPSTWQDLELAGHRLGLPVQDSRFMADYLNQLVIQGKEPSRRSRVCLHACMLWLHQAVLIPVPAWCFVCVVAGLCDACMRFGPGCEPPLRGGPIHTPTARLLYHSSCGSCWLAQLASC